MRRYLTRKLITRTLVYTLVYLVVFVLVSHFAKEYLYQPVYDATVNRSIVSYYDIKVYNIWNEVPEPQSTGQVGDLSSGREAFDQASGGSVSDDVMKRLSELDDLGQFGVSAEMVNPEEIDTYMEDKGYNDSEPFDEHLIEMIDSRRFDTLVSMATPLCVAVYLIGFIITMMGIFDKAIGFLEELTDAVADLVINRDSLVRLSEPLSSVQNRLNEVREQALHNEYAVETAERRKDELVAYLAHDLRTPLTSVVGYLSILDDSPDLPSEQRQQYISKALAKAETIDALSAEFFEITRYNLSAIPIERTNIDVLLFLSQLADDFLPQLRARNLKANVSAPENESFRVDPDKMARALGNILRNAVAYADQGTTINLRAEKIGDDDGWHITISNQGREIAPEHLQSIFDRFFREDGARSSGGNNAGLGLAIAKEIVKAHGGEIFAESENGITSFTINLP